MPFTAGILTAILAYTWFLQPRLASRGALIPAAIVLGLALLRAWRSGQWGLAAGALLPGLRAAALFTIPCAAALLVAGASLGTLHDRRDFLGTLAWLVVWGGAQQWVLQTVVLGEARELMPRRAAVVVAAALFASAHLPNPFLTAMTLAGGLGWCAIYSRHPNVLPLALSHALATLAILYAFDEEMTGGLRIGLAYLELDR
jgi:membrane protease YdiL (CAAX protease family)